MECELNVAEIADTVATVLSRKPLHIPASKRSVERLAWCTGGAQSFIDQAFDIGADMYISGEVSEQTTHAARENDLHYLAVGHHASEQYGVRALGEHLANRFSLRHINVEIDNPV